MTSAAHPSDAVWPRVAGLIDARDADGVAAAVLDLDEDGRRAVAAALPGHLRAAWARRDPWAGIGDAHWAYRAAGAGTLGGPAAVASWLNRREFRNRWPGEPDDDGRLLDIWAVRDDAWRADLAQRLALRLRGPRYVGLGLVLTLLRETGAEPPDHDPLVVGWVGSGPPRPKDPLLPVLLPRVFEAEGVGRALRDDRSWPRTLATMAARGDLDRGTLLDGCVRRFLRGGTELELRFFVRLHHLLTHDDPSARRGETAERARDYARLLPSAPGPVATLALELLREVPDLPAPLQAEAFDGLLFRPEAGLVRTGLAWLRETVRHRPGLADACAGAVAQAFGHESYAVREKAVRLALTLPDGTDGAPLADAAPLLPPDLGTRVTARFGGDPAVSEPVGADPAPEPLGPAAPRTGDTDPLPEPITTPAELAARISAHDGGWRRVEQVMDGFVRLAHADPDGLRAAMKPSLERLEHFYGARHWPWEHVTDWLFAAARLLTDPASDPTGWRDRMPGTFDGPLDMLNLYRAAEIVGAAEAGTMPPLLLATPTASTGHLDPAVLVRRLEICAGAGADPGPADLQQALLRLPPGPHPDAAGRAARIATPAARTAARWLAAPPVPRVLVRPGPLPPHRDGRTEISIVVDGLEGPPADADLDTAFPFTGAGPSEADDRVRPPRSRRPGPVEDGPTGLPLVDAVFAALPPDASDRGWFVHWWPSRLPSHPEVVAAHLAPGLHRHALMVGDASRPALLLARTPANGPFAADVAEFLAHRLAAEHGARSDDLILDVCARGEFPAAAVGRHVARLLLEGEVRPSLMTDGLERAAEAGAFADVWAVLAVALPMLCPGPGERPVHGLDRLFALGARTARWCGARGAIPEIEALAARKGAAAYVRAARGLAARLAS
ncbi:hypothetical protein [Actinomadura sediminis]|uniref:Secreted protein n=1 Tax=Actinomadura sediminis TaxID=1038904 RepID=A0ABW3EST9_9ACTN